MGNLGIGDGRVLELRGQAISGGRDENRGDCFTHIARSDFCVFRAERILSIPASGPERHANRIGSPVHHRADAIALCAGGICHSGDWRGAAAGESLRAAGTGAARASDRKYPVLPHSLGAAGYCAGSGCDRTLVRSVFPLPATFLGAFRSESRLDREWQLQMSFAPAAVGAVLQGERAAVSFGDLPAEDESNT